MTLQINDENCPVSDAGPFRQPPVPSKKELHEDLLLHIEQLQAAIGKKPNGWYKKDKKTHKRRQLPHYIPGDNSIPLRLRMYISGQLHYKQLSYEQLLEVMYYVYLYVSDDDKAIGSTKFMNFKDIVKTKITNIQPDLSRRRRNFWDIDPAVHRIQKLYGNPSLTPVEKEILQNQIDYNHPDYVMERYCPLWVEPSIDQSRRFYCYNMSRFLLKSSNETFYDAFLDYLKLLQRKDRYGNYVFPQEPSYLNYLFKDFKANGISIQRNLYKMHWMVRDRDLAYSDDLLPKLRQLFGAECLHKTSLLYKFTKTDHRFLAAMAYAKTQAHIFTTLYGESHYVGQYLSSVNRIGLTLLYKYPTIVLQSNIVPTCKDDVDCANPFCPTSESNPSWAAETPPPPSSSFYEKYFKSYVDKLKGPFNKLYSLMESVLTKLDSFLDGVSGFFSSIAEYIVSLWDSTIKPLYNFLMRSNEEGLDPIINITECIAGVLFLVLANFFEDERIKMAMHVMFFLSLRIPGNAIALFKKVISVVGSFMQTEPTSSGEESDSAFDMIFSSFNETSFVALGAFIMVAFFGVKYSRDIHKSFVQVCSNSFKNLHFIGGGLLGLERIVKYVRSLFKTVKTFLAKLRGKDIEPPDPIVDKIAKWATRVRAYKTDAGLDVIKTSVKASDEVISLYHEGIVYYQLTFEDKIPPRICSDVIQTCRISTDLFNIVTKMRKYGRGRFTPFHIQFYGEAGIGKTTLIQKLIDSIHHTFYSDVPRSNISYSRGATDHWDGYTGQKILVKDEAYPIKDAKLLAEDLTVISCNPMITPQAELHNKGNVFMESEFMISSCNTMFPECTDVYYMKAIHRRRHYLVWVICDPKVIDPTSHKFDEKLFKQVYPGQESHDFPHLKFTICKPVNDSNSTNPKPYAQDEKLPNGLTFPLENLSYYQMLAMMFNRRNAMRAEEAKLLNDPLRPILMTLDYQEVRKAMQGLASSKKVDIPPVFDGLQEPPLSFPEDIPNADELYDFFVAKYSNEQLVDETLEIGNTSTSDDEDLEEAFKNRKMTITQALVYAQDDPKKLQMLSEVYDLSLNPMVLPYDFDMNVNDAPNPTEFTDIYDIDTLLDELDECGENFVDATSEIQENVTIADEPEDDMMRRARILKAKLEKGEMSAAERILRSNRSLEGHPLITHIDSSPKLFGDNRIYFDLKASDNDFVTLSKSYTIGGQCFPQTSTLGALASKSIKRFQLPWPEVYIPPGKFGNRTRSHVSIMFLRSLGYDAKGTYMKAKGIGYIASYMRDVHGMLYEDAIKVISSMVIADYHNYSSFSYLRTYSREDQRELIDLAKKQYVVYAMFASFQRKIKEKAVESKRIFLDRLRGGWTWFWDIVGPYKKSLLLLAGSLVAYYAITSFSRMFVRPSSTSRTHFGRNIVRRGITPTSGDDIISNMRMKVKDYLIEVTFRQIVDGVQQDACTANVQRIDRYLIVPAHAMRKVMRGDEGHIEMSLKPTNNSDEVWDYHVCRSHVKFVDNKDIAILYTPQMPPAPDFSSMFLTVMEWANNELPTTMYSFYRCGKELICQYMDDMKIVSTPITYNTGETYFGPYLHLRGEIYKGASGSPLITKLPKGRCVFAGFVSAKRYGDSVWASVLLKEEYDQYVKEFKVFKPITHEGAYTIVEFTPTCADAHATSLITEHVTVAGRVKREHMLGFVNKTSYRRTPISPAFSSDRCPAILSPMDPRVPVGAHPLQHSVNKTGRDTMKPMPPEIYLRAACWVSDWITSLNPSYIFKVYDDWNDIIRGDSYLNQKPVDVSTSPGIPWVFDKFAGKPPGKRAYLDYDDEGFIINFDPDLELSLCEIDSSIRRGVIPPLSNYEFPKDELRPIEKVNQLKTRSVTVMPMEMTILYRKYYMSLDSMLHRYADGSFPVCVGMNIYDKAWTNMYHQLRKISSTACDMDVGNWDGHWPYWLSDAVTRVADDLYERSHRSGICEQCDGNPEGVYCSEFSKEQYARKAIADYNLYGCSQFYDVVLKKWRGMSSGYPGTADKNSLSHCILILSFYILHCNRLRRLDMKRLQIFRQNVVFYVYGDDILIAIKDDFKSFFSYNHLISYYWEFGWPCTSSSKTSQIIEKPLSQVTFLKHSFVLDPKYGSSWVHAALDKGVIEDLCYWIRKSTKPQTQLYENLDTALEYAYAHGKTYFCELRRRVMEACIKYKVPMILPEYAHYEEVMSDRFFNEP